jgi:alpha-L-rhamnosidase
VWQTGKIASAQNIQVPYAGPSLKPFTRYYWRVKVYNQHGEASDWSEPAFFETAMLQPSDWSAKWISDGKSQPQKDEEFYGEDPAPLFRKQFKPKKAVATARLYVSGQGLLRSLYERPQGGRSCA